MSDTPGVVRGSAGRKAKAGSNQKATVIFDGSIDTDLKWDEFKVKLKALACEYGLTIYEFNGPVDRKNC